MKIGIVSFLAGSGGAEPGSAVFALAEALVGLGHKSVVITRRQEEHDPPWVSDAPFETQFLAAGPLCTMDEAAAMAYVGDFVRRLGPEVKAGGYDILHSHGWLAGLAAQLAASAGQVPLVHTFQGLRLMESSASKSTAPSRLRAERACAMRADHLIATSAAEREALVAIGVMRRQITVVPPGTVAAQGVSVVPSPRYPDAPRQLVAFGEPAQVSDLVRALTFLPGIELVVCTPPEHPDGSDDLPRLADLVARLGLADRVRWESVPDATVRTRLIRGAEAVVCMAPSAHAGTEHLEAMALGAPVVAANAPAAEAVVDGVTGFHALGLRPRELAWLLRKLLTNATLREQMGIAGRDRAHSRYTWSRIAAETLRVYERVAGPVHETVQTAR